METLNKVWVIEKNVKYPGIVISKVAEVYIVLKFDKAIWRRIVCKPEDLENRDDDFSQYIFSIRKTLTQKDVPLIFNLP